MTQIQIKIHKDLLVVSEIYWYIFQSKDMCQLLQVKLDEDSKAMTHNSVVFEVQLYNDWNHTAPLEIILDKEGYISNLFKFENKRDAEIIWCNNYITKFKDCTSVEYGRFIELINILNTEQPDLLLKGL